MMQRLRDALRRSLPLNRLIASIDRTSCVWTPSGRTDCAAMHGAEPAANLGARWKSCKCEDPMSPPRGLRLPSRARR